MCGCFEGGGGEGGEVITIKFHLLIYNFIRLVIINSLIQEGQLSVSGERMCTILVNRLED